MTNETEQTKEEGWVVDTTLLTAAHSSGVRVKFTPAVDGWKGACIAFPLPASGLDIKMMARLMREAGEAFEREFYE